MRLTSPFTPPPALELTGLGLADVLVLPHDDRPGRADRDAMAQSAFAGRVKLVPLRDGELAIQDGEELSVLRR